MEENANAGPSKERDAGQRLKTPPEQEKRDAPRVYPIHFFTKICPCKHAELPEDGPLTSWQPSHHLKFRRYPAAALLNWTIRQYCSGSAFKTYPWRQKAQEAIARAFVGEGDGQTRGIKLRTLWDGSRVHKTWISGVYRNLDNCLFFGCLASTYDDRHHSLAPLVMGTDEEHEEAISRIGGIVGGFFDRPSLLHEKGSSVMAVIMLFGRIKDDTTKPGEPSSFYPLRMRQIVLILIHEMVHAYVDLFTCLNGRCGRDIWNTRGLAGHGELFITLYGVVMTEVYSWFEGHPGFVMPSKAAVIYVRQDALRYREEEEKLREAWGKAGLLRGALAYSGPDKEWLACISEEGLLITSPSVAGMMKHKTKGGRIKESEGTERDISGKKTGSQEIAQGVEKNLPDAKRRGKLGLCVVM